jgi:hypothetical protein
MRLYLTQKLSLPATGSNGRSYWIARGWSDIESRIKVDNIRSTYKKKISPYSREFWTSKINPNTNEFYTIEEADFERNSRRPIRKEYWISRGYTEQESQKLALETKKKNNIAGNKNSCDRNENEIRANSKRCKEYWILRGFSEEEAKQLISELQITFSLEKCIDKYGFEEGTERWKERQKKWQNTLNSKPIEEREKINKKKKPIIGPISKAEKELFEHLKNLGIAVDKQFSLSRNDGRWYHYDIVYNNKIIEFNGDYWHANPKKYNESDIFSRNMKVCTASDIWRKDREKIECAIRNNFEVMIVWESDYKKDKQGTIDKCLNFLTQ